VEKGPAGDLLARLQDALAREMLRNGWPVTLSIGAITFARPCWGVDLMIQRVDALMYEAKRNGKDRVEHQVVPDQPDAWVASWPIVERRATARVLISRRARSWSLGEGVGTHEFVNVRDISVSGIGLCVEKPFAVGTLVVVEPLLGGGRTLLARVVRAAPTEGGWWLHGCLFPTQLNEEEVRGWISPEDVGGSRLEDRGSTEVSPLDSGDSL
jgi:hypothetical protein